MNSYWDKRYMSNTNSTGLDKTEEKKFFSFFNLLMRGRSFKSVIDFGCGDMRMLQGSRTMIERYVGVDASDVIIADHTFEYRENKGMTFYNTHSFFNRLTWDGVLDAEAVLLFNVLYHVMNDEDYDRIIKMAMNKAEEYIYILTWIKEPKGYDRRHQKYRSWKDTHKIIDKKFTMIEIQQYDDVNSFMIYRRK